MTPKQAKAMRRGQSLMKNASKALRRKWAAKAARTRALKRAAGLNPEINVVDTEIAFNPHRTWDDRYRTLYRKISEMGGGSYGFDTNTLRLSRPDLHEEYVRLMREREQIVERPMASNPELMILSANPGSCRTENGSKKMAKKKKKYCYTKRKGRKGRKKGAGRKVRYNRKLRSISWLRKNLSKKKFNRLAKRKGLKRLG